LLVLVWPEDKVDVDDGVLEELGMTAHTVVAHSATVTPLVRASSNRRRVGRARSA